jgi:hypothetical protein
MGIGNDAPGTNGNTPGLPQEYQTDTLVIPPAIPSLKPVTINTNKHTTFGDGETRANVCRVVSEHGFTLTEEDPRLTVALKTGATVAEFAAAAGIARSAGKTVAYALGIVTHRQADAERMAREGTKTGSGSTNDPRSVWYVPSEKKSL